MKKTHLWLNEDQDLVEMFKYPAGEWQVRLTPEGYALVSSSDEVNITAEVRSGEDLYKLALLVDAVRHAGQEPPEVEVAMPYLFASRADRRFTPGDCHGLQVMRSMIPLDVPIRTLDAHNLTAVNRLNIHNISPLSFITRTINHAALKEHAHKVALVFPDEGASKRYDIPRYLGSNTYALETVKYYGTKVRDAVTGKVLNYSLPRIQERVTIVIDDICDGGRTFEEIGRFIRPTQTAYLYVTHGIFSKGLESLLGIYKMIYTTDTFETVADPRLTRFNSSMEIWK